MARVVQRRFQHQRVLVPAEFAQGVQVAGQGYQDREPEWPQCVQGGESGVGFARGGQGREEECYGEVGDLVVPG